MQSYLPKDQLPEGRTPASYSQCLYLFIFQTLREKTSAIAALLLLQTGKSTPNNQCIKRVALSLLALLACPKWFQLGYSASRRNYPTPGAWGAAFNRLRREFTLPERREPGQAHTVSWNKGKVMKATIAKIHNSAFCLFRVFCFSHGKWNVWVHDYITSIFFPRQKQIKNTKPPILQSLQVLKD